MTKKLNDYPQVMRELYATYQTLVGWGFQEILIGCGQDPTKLGQPFPRYYFLLQAEGVEPYILASHPVTEPNPHQAMAIWEEYLVLAEAQKHDWLKGTALENKMLRMNLITALRANGFTILDSDSQMGFLGSKANSEVN